MFSWLRRRRPAHETAADPPPFDLAAIPGAFESDEGLPRPQWPVIDAWAAARPASEDAHGRWCEVQRQWLRALREALAGEFEYRIEESEDVLLLCARTPDDAELLLRAAHGAYAAVNELLADAETARVGKLPVLAVAGAADFYRYLSYFDAEGEYGGAAGACIREGGVHVAVLDAFAPLERTLVHEMVHAMLPPTVPAWLEEGVAELVARRLAGGGGGTFLRLDPADLRRQQHFWRKRGLAAFWSGHSFRRPDRGQELSYTLAEVLVHTLLADHRRRFRDFFRAAVAEDGGEAAALQHLGVSLGDVARGFLGEGNWRPASTKPAPGERPEDDHPG